MSKTAGADQRVKDQLFRIDSTYADVNFAYSGKAGKEVPVQTLEELQYPNYFNKTVGDVDDIGMPEPEVSSVQPNSESSNPSSEDAGDKELKEQHLTFAENQRGVSYNGLIGPYLKGAKHITITDPYIRLFYQAKNLMELLETVVKQKQEEDEIVVSLITVEDEFKGEQQREYFEKIQASLFAVGVKFAYSFDTTGSQHARHITTDTGWEISLDRGLDIYQQYDVNDAFSLTNRLQKHRACKPFEVTFIKVEQ
ncbi:MULTISPECIES: MIT C-terminal domain-containing protein [Vibrio]|uniref:MIT C-terminal domain-containing protein n=1 Tax=Vibrio TaxID=662 RepID=UPI000AB13189|nr:MULTISPECIES: MIT C-terminal domain-containing protein [Vibrio]MDW2305488.1 MIT C-terminal domain-containing protein [Vibrio sp. 1457]MDW2315862.1 MIT C-terminal domain-containing protein [Vibrio sp. 1456-1]